MVMPAGAMGVAVRKLFRRGVANGNNLHIEIERLPRQCVIGVDSHCLALKAHDADNLSAVIGGEFDLLAALEFHFAKRFAGNIDKQ
jgi:hypothetical protein